MRQNLQNLFMHISRQHNVDELIKAFDEWRPSRQNTITVLNDILQTLNKTQFVTNCVNATTSAVGAIAEAALVASVFVPGLDLVTIPLLVSSAVVNGASFSTSLAKWGISSNQEKKMKEFIKEDHTHTCKFSESMDKLVKESEGRMKLDPADAYIPGDTIVRTASYIGAAVRSRADVAFEFVPTAGKAVSRSVAAVAGSIGIVVDVGMMLYSIVDLDEGSVHQLSPILEKTIKQLKNDANKINAICYYAALHKIDCQLLLN